MKGERVVKSAFPADAKNQFITLAATDKSYVYVKKNIDCFGLSRDNQKVEMPPEVTAYQLYQPL